MNAMKKGLLVALIHILLVSTLGAKLLYDRATRPRVWVETMSYDPSLPIRGRYVALRAVVETDIKPPSDSDKTAGWYPARTVRLEARNGKLFALKDETGNVSIMWQRGRDGKWVSTLYEPSLFFIPEHVTDPSWRQAGERLWFEATIPKKGSPRPIRLAVSKPDGTFTPLDLR